MIKAKEQGMKVNGIIRTALIVIIVIANVGCDQISKNIVRETISYNEIINVFGDYLILTKVENTGAFLSLGDSLPEPIKFILLTIFPIVVLIVAFVYMWFKVNNLYSRLGIAFIIGGGIGNLYDRLIFGSVTDFLHIDLGLIQTGIFNMADVSIMVGMFIVIINQLGSNSGLKPTHHHQTMLLPLIAVVDQAISLT